MPATLRPRRFARPLVQRSPAWRRRPGAALVEFAMTCPLVFLLLFGALEFARFNMIRHTVSNAAYEGARRGLPHGATATDCRTAATQILSTVGVAESTVTVTPDTIDTTTTEVTVAVSVPFGKSSWLAPVYFRSATLSSSITLTRDVNATGS